MRTLAALTVIFLAFPLQVRGGQSAPDPFLGRWVLDPKASKYPAGACPRSMTIEMHEEARGVHYHSETLPAQGRPFHVDFTARYDGKPALVTGDQGILLPVSLRQQGPRHIHATYSNAFQVVATSDRELSEDGTVMTITTVSHDALGRNVTNVGVYRRDNPAGTPRR